MTEYLALQKTGFNTATLLLSVARLGTFLVGGRNATVKINIEDSDNLRSISANLNHLKNTNCQDDVTVDFGKGQRFEMDKSVWRECADALLAFSLCVDCAKLGI